MNLNELCLPDGRIFSPYLACMLKGVLHDAIEKQWMSLLFQRWQKMLKKK